jgi:ABC-type branched-subunit amino acid transport system substrate-binding protein
MDEWRAAKIAVEEINASGGILGRQVEIVWRDSESQVSKTMENVTELIEKQGVQMIFGGVSSAVAIVCGDLCQKYGVLFMATVTASNATTGKDGHRHTFRVGYNSWMGGKALGSYLKQRFRDKTYFYITADYTWGWSSEASLRYFTGTQDSERHKVALVPFPDAMESDFYKALFMASAAKPDVLVLNLFGKHMEMALSMVADLGLKKKMQVVVPVLELSQAEQSGPQTMAGIIGVADWIWRVPYQYNYARGKAFVEKFVQINGRYPCFGASSAYTVLYEYKSAVERAGTFKPVKVIKALEGHTFELLKDQEQWRALDHQCIQSVYLLKCKPAAEVIKDRFKEDYFEILESFPGEQVVRTEAEWIADRQRAGKPPVLEPLPGE